MRIQRNRALRGRIGRQTGGIVVAALLGLAVGSAAPLSAEPLTLVPPASGTGSFWSAALWDSAGGPVSPGPTDDLTMSLTSPLDLHLYLGDTLDEPARFGSVSTLAVSGSHSVTIDGAGDVPDFTWGGLNLNLGPELPCRIDGTLCSLVIDLEPGAAFELRDAPMLMAGDVQVIHGVLAITKTVDSTALFGSVFVSPYVQLGGEPSGVDPSRSSFVLSGFGETQLGIPMARMNVLKLLDLDDTALRLTDGAVLGVNHLTIQSRQTPASSLPATTRIEIGDAVSETSKLLVETAAFTGYSSDVVIDSVGRDIQMIVAPRGEIELTGDSSELLRSNIQMTSREGIDPGQALLEIDGGLLDVTTALPAVVPSAARWDIAITAADGGTSTLRVHHGGELRGSNTAVSRSPAPGHPLSLPGVARLEVASGGLVSNGNLFLAGAALEVVDGTVRAESVSLSDPLGDLGQAPSQATWTSTASRLESAGLSLAVYSGSTARFEDGATGTDVYATRVGGSAYGLTTGVATSRLALDGPGTRYDTGNLSIGLPGYTARYGGTTECPLPTGNGSGAVEVTNGAILHVGNAQNVASEPLGIRPSIALAAAHDEYPASELRLDPASAVVIAAAGSTLPQPGSVVVGQDGRLAGGGVIRGETLATTPDVVTRAGGLVAPGCSAGRLMIAGSYVQQDGELELEIGGANAGEYDVIDAVNGAVIQGGTIRFEAVAGYTGDVGAQLDLFAGRPVSVDPNVAIVDNTGMALDFDRTTGIATITQIVPEPSLVASLAAGLGLLRVLSDRRRRA